VVAFGIILALFYARIGNNQNYIRNYIGVGYEINAILFVGMLNALAFYPVERDVFYREHADGACGVEAFMLSYLTIEIPFEIIASLLCTLFVDMVIGLNGSYEAFLVTAYVIFCFINAGESAGIIFCNIVKVVGFSASVTSVCLSIFSAMAGQLAINMPEFLQDINYVNVMKYGAAVLGIVQYSGLTFVCTNGQLLPDGTCPITSGDQLLALYKFDTNNYHLYLGLMAAVTVGYRLIAYLVLKIRTAF
jgi:hypothetical protein